MIGALLDGAGWVIGAGAALVQWRLRRVCREAVVRAAHELRGPLAAARLGLDLGARTGELTAVRLHAIDLELGRAAAALQDLSAASGSGRVRSARRRGPVEVPELLADCVDGQHAVAAARGVVLALEWTGDGTSVWGDRVRIGQAVRNLVANGLEHGSGDVRVSGRVDGGAVRIEVADSGPGLPAPIAELTRRARRARGLRGRGLAIARDVVVEHGGRLAAAPSERGARLVLELPALAEGWHRSGGESGPRVG